MIRQRNSQFYQPAFSHEDAGHQYHSSAYAGGMSNGRPLYHPYQVNQVSTHGNGKSTSVREKEWRSSNDYREDYFNKNKGIGGYGYICSQCWKPMRKGSNMHVDHIIPPSKFARVKKVKDKSSPNGVKKVKTSFLARALNNSFNCAAICPQCNYKKSNKINKQILSGYAMKTLEVAYNVAQVVISIPIMGTAFILWGTRKGVGALFGRK